MTKRKVYVCRESNIVQVDNRETRREDMKLSQVSEGEKVSISRTLRRCKLR